MYVVLTSISLHIIIKWDFDMQNSLNNNDYEEQHTKSIHT